MVPVVPACSRAVTLSTVFLCNVVANLMVGDNEPGKCYNVPGHRVTAHADEGGSRCDLAFYSNVS